MSGKSSSTSRVLGRLLLEAGAITEAELQAALEAQRGTCEQLGWSVVRRALDPERVAHALAEHLRLPFAEPQLAPEPDAAALVERGLALRHRVVPLRMGAGTLQVAM